MQADHHDAGPDTLQWFALSVFRSADMIGIDGHVSFLPQKRKKKAEHKLLDEEGCPACCCAGCINVGDRECSPSKGEVRAEYAAVG